MNKNSLKINDFMDHLSTHDEIEIVYGDFTPMSNIFVVKYKITYKIIYDDRDDTNALITFMTENDKFSIDIEEFEEEFEEVTLNDNIKYYKCYKKKK